MNTTVIDNHVMPFAAKISENRYLNAIRDGVALMMPFMIIGSFFLIIAFLPIPGYEDFMASVFGDMWMDKLLYPVGATYDLIAVFATIGTAYRLAQKHSELEPILMAAIALSAYLLITPFNIAHTLDSGEIINVSGLDIAALGSQGMFLGLMTAIYSTELCRWLINKKVTIKLPDSVPPAVGQSFTALIPALVVIISLTVLRIGIEAFDIESVQSIIINVISEPLKLLGGSIVGTTISTLAEHLLWATGVHGTSITGSIMEPIWLTLTDENRQAFQAGLEVPHIITNEFNAIFVNFGGSGGLLALVLLLAFRSRSIQCKSIGKLGFGASVFNISEPIMFGVPIVLNPLLIIPFVIVPFTSVFITYLAMYSGIVPSPAGIAVPWTTPIFLSGYLTTGGHISGAILQLVNLIIAMMIYYPFFRKWDSICLEKE